MVRRGHVVQRQRDAGGHLGAEEHEQHAAGREPPAGAGRQLFQEEVARASDEAAASSSHAVSARGVPDPSRSSCIDAHQDAAGVDAHRDFIETAWRRAARHRAIGGEPAAMTWTAEGVIRVVP